MLVQYASYQARAHVVLVASHCGEEWSWLLNTTVSNFILSKIIKKIWNLLLILSVRNLEIRNSPLLPVFIVK